MGIALLDWVQKVTAAGFFKNHARIVHTSASVRFAGTGGGLVDLDADVIGLASMNCDVAQVGVDCQLRARGNSGWRQDVGLRELLRERIKIRVQARIAAVDDVKNRKTNEH